MQQQHTKSFQPFKKNENYINSKNKRTLLYIPFKGTIQTPALWGAYFCCESGRGEVGRPSRPVPEGSPRSNTQQIMRNKEKQGNHAF